MDPFAAITEMTNYPLTKISMQKTSWLSFSKKHLRIFSCLQYRYFVILQVVTIKAVTVLCTMAEASGTFMQRRVIKDAIPSMIAFLDKQASVSLKAGPVYSQSQSFKQQLAVLRSLGRLCRQLEISEATLSSVVWACTQYLSCRQPKELQQVGKIINSYSSRTRWIWADIFLRGQTIHV